jgi:hypothetical protein
VRACLLVVVAGCGRLDFQPINGTTGTAIDGHAIATVDSVTNDPVTLTGVYAISGNGIDPTSVVTIDLATGDVATIGQLPASLGVLGGLTSWDANTLYAAGNQHFIKITLAPFSAELAATTPAVEIVGLETEGAYLTAVDATTSKLLIYDPSTFAAPTTKPLGIVASGGDIAPDSFAAGAHYFSNTTRTLYAVYTATGNTTVTGTTNLSAVQGMFSQTNFARYYVTDSDLDEVIPIDVGTAALGTPIPLCHPCPGTAYDLLTGDAAATTP